MTDRTSPETETLWAAIRQRDANINGAFSALNDIEAQLHEMRSLKGWRLNLIREHLEKAKAALRRPGYAPTPDAPSYDQLRSVFEAAYGLCMGYDWNNGTAAKACGYKRKLLSAVNAIKEVPDFEEKYRASPDTSTDRNGGCACTSIDRSHCREPDCAFADTSIEGNTK